ncbi:hypothetical protein PoB_007687900 [Plakobranchus ocellatus]|uniref:Uncharacterized protein n=1 Tax=Plakobranchus ocellatus TaxID=259542 RepID=A0AAV4E266_9GAST|nr:hypothetical protein PoB_007687900 [Plakobranchus ocellatus]
MVVCFLQRRVSLQRCHQQTQAKETIIIVRHLQINFGFNGVRHVEKGVHLMSNLKADLTLHQAVTIRSSYAPGIV